ncbi:MAG: alpha-mannosidase, partial [Ruminococcaceae bacterium]|nr:alpha-mannosidase [Oscillospiraceae bacterium]
MQTQHRKVKQYVKLLAQRRWKEITPVQEIGILPTDYKKDNTLPSPSLFKPFAHGSRWGEGFDTHAWFHFTLPVAAENTYLCVKTERDGWDAKNPQFLVYLDGKIVQGLDTNHHEVLLEAGKPCDVYLYAYIGSEAESASLFADTRVLDTDVDKLYYDLLFPLESLEFLDKESREYAMTLYHLHTAVSMLSLYDLSSADFLASVKVAGNYMDTEFYGKYCNTQEKTTVCIGHTHIDCAWLWTLRQTREKVQRSFATVLELMRRYPEYKFMSSQALLYKNLKEEAPALYEEVRERIREGRWECEGAMWVEADCNLSSGESLVRQVLYGKRFFKQEFGVDNRVLWLPDVFGYSAALPQILKKCGVDWFVTSKISWNDINRMPYDTFLWRGIDGTEINTHFLTAQTDKGEESVNQTTYVSNTHPAMISGAWKRYSQKQLNDEALLTFGFGDGGGGPTAEHLELARRGVYGVPGVPNVKIDFAGDYLRRLEEKIDGNRLLPRWQGELYLEFHRGTYTTMADNKKNNRKCEYLYQSAELFGTVAEKLSGLPFPKKSLHDGWEMILTNQFHDIIPGSSIKEVYDQCQIDYADIRARGEAALSASSSAITAGISKDAGYVVFNPTSNAGRGIVRLDGESVYAEHVVPTGYTVCNEFTHGNHVRIDGQTVETELYRVTFDDDWQILSLIDKRVERELIRPGEVGNELRVYADHPDTYDGWEWQAYSREEYTPITSVTSVETLEDGIRRGIRILRPYRSSTISQTVWFYDREERIDFETTVDWQERHVMLKTAFPTDINTERATYDVQFGTVERPTHFNTSWDTAKFEVCAHKFADISDGSYGVALLNDCKYGHDIHDGVIQLSLLRSPTYPNPEADRGTHTFTYALAPHVGTLNDSHVKSDAYALNLPLSLLPSTGTETTLPASFSVLRT